MLRPSSRNDGHDDIKQMGLSEHPLQIGPHIGSIPINPWFLTVITGLLFLETKRCWKFVVLCTALAPRSVTRCRASLLVWDPVKVPKLQAAPSLLGHLSKLHGRYILYTAFSPQTAITDWSSVLYSVIYTSLPTIVVGVLDKDLSQKTLVRYPKLYGFGHREEGYNIYLFWLTMIDTLWQSLVIFYVPYFAYRHSRVDIWSIGSLWTISLVVLVNIHLAMDILLWTWITHAAVWGSIVATIICLVILDSIPQLPNYWTIYHVVTWGSYWLNFFLILCLALLPRFLVKVMKQRFWPSDIQIAREAEMLRNGSGHPAVELNEITRSPGS